MRSFSPLLVVFLVLTLLSASACSTKRAVQEEDGSFASQTQRSVEAQIAEFIGTGYEGASETFTNTRYGTATVTIGRAYHSALDIPCREASIQGSQRTRAAACQDKNKGWILAPDILGDGAL